MNSSHYLWIITVGNGRIALYQGVPIVNVPLLRAARGRCPATDCGWRPARLPAAQGQGERGEQPSGSLSLGPFQILEATSTWRPSAPSLTVEAVSW